MSDNIKRVKKAYHLRRYLGQSPATGEIMLAKGGAMAEYANPNALVTADWVAEHLNDPSVRLVRADRNVDPLE